MHTREKSNLEMALGLAADIAADKGGATHVQLIDQIDGLVGYHVAAADGATRMRWPAPVCERAGLDDTARQRPRGTDDRL